MTAKLQATVGSDRATTRGFTLVELLVTLAILAAIATLGTSLTRSWVDDAHANEAAAQLLQAYAKTRAMALRNDAKRDLGAPTALMCITSGEVHTQNIPSGSALECGTNSVWHAVIAGQPDTQITTDGAPFSCIALDNRGLPTAYASCSTSQSITVSKGSSHVVQKTFGGT